MGLKYNQAGIAHLAAILVIAVIALIGFTGWKVWDNTKNKSNESITQNSQDNSRTTTEEPASDSEKLTIPQWGVQFNIPSSIPDLMVDTFTDYPADNGHVVSSVADLNSPTLEAEGKIKTTGTQERHEKLGYILRQESNTDYYPGTTIEEYAAINNYAGIRIGNYYYVYITTYASENTDTYLNAIKDAIQSSLESTN